MQGAGNRRATKVHTTQKAAIKQARKIAINQDSEFFIHGRNGRICEKNSYGNDPHPRRGRSTVPTGKLYNPYRVGIPLGFFAGCAAGPRSEGGRRVQESAADGLGTLASIVRRRTVFERAEADRVWRVRWLEEPSSL